MASSFALAVAPSFILTKKGLVSVLVIRHAEISAALALPAKATPSATAPRVAAITDVFMSSSQGNKQWRRANPQPFKRFAPHGFRLALLPPCAVCPATISIKQNTRQQRKR